MNERIKELAYKVWYMPCSDNEHHLALEKFAELIVRECAGIADDPDTDMLRVGQAIREHFGVK